MEIWKDVEGYEGKYQISNYGRILALNFKRTKLPKLKAQVISNGYFYVMLSKNSIAKNCSVHRLVAKHFLQSWDNKLEVNHIDGNKLNNHISNLEMVTALENTRHARLIGLCKDTGSNNSRAKYSKEEVDMIRWYYHCKGFMQKDIAKLFNTAQPQINFIIRYKRYPHIDGGIL